ncbi:hypothetical protein ACLOJK_029214 [Asimina triloba]
MVWFCERRGCSTDRYLWREFLICRSLQSYTVFSTRNDVKAIVNPPDPTLGWESRFFFARLSSERDIWGVPEQWEEPFPNLIPQSFVRIFALQEEFFHWCKLVHFVALEKGKKHAPKRAHSVGGSPMVIDRVDLGRASSPQEFVARSRSEGTVLPLGEAQLREELEVSHVEVVASDPRLWPTIVKEMRTAAEWNLSAPTIPVMDMSKLYQMWPPFILKLTFHARKIIFHFLPLIELVEGFSSVVTLGVTRGKLLDFPFSTPASHLPPPVSSHPTHSLSPSFLNPSRRLHSSNVGQRHLRLRSDQRRLCVNVVFASASTTCFGQIASAVSRPLFFLCSSEIASASLFRSPQPLPFLKSSSSYLLNLLFSSSAPVKLQRPLLPSRTPNRSSFHGIKIQLSSSSPPLRIHRRKLAVMMLAKRKEEMEEIRS